MSEYSGLPINCCVWLIFCWTKLVFASHEVNLLFIFATYQISPQTVINIHSAVSCQLSPLHSCQVQNCSTGSLLFNFISGHNELFVTRVTISSQSTLGCHSPKFFFTRKVTFIGHLSDRKLFRLIGIRKMHKETIINRFARSQVVKESTKGLAFISGSDFGDSTKDGRVGKVKLISNK